MITDNGNSASAVETPSVAPNKATKEHSQHRASASTKMIQKKVRVGKKRGPKKGTTHAVRVTLNDLNARLKPDHMIPISRRFFLENFAEGSGSGSVSVVAAQGKKVTVEYRREGRKPQIRVIDFSKPKSNS